MRQGCAKFAGWASPTNLLRHRLWWAVPTLLVAATVHFLDCLTSEADAARRRRPRRYIAETAETQPASKSDDAQLSAPETVDSEFDSSYDNDADDAMEQSVDDAEKPWDQDGWIDVQTLPLRHDAEVESDNQVLREEQVQEPLDPNVARLKLIYDELQRVQRRLDRAERLAKNAEPTVVVPYWVASFYRQVASDVPPIVKLPQGMAELSTGYGNPLSINQAQQPGIRRIRQLMAEVQRMVARLQPLPVGRKVDLFGSGFTWVAVFDEPPPAGRLARVGMEHLKYWPLPVRNADQLIEETIGSEWLAVHFHQWKGYPFLLDEDDAEIRFGEARKGDWFERILRKEPARSGATFFSPGTSR